MSARRPRWGRPRLRTRVTAVFALGALAVSALLAEATWNLTSSYMLTLRQQSAARQAAANALVIQSTVRSDLDAVPDVLAGVSGPQSGVLLRRGDRWVTSAQAVTVSELPHEAVELAESGTAARQRVVIDGTPRLVTAIPLPSIDAVYVHVFSLSELDRTLRFISGTLLIG